MKRGGWMLSVLYVCVNEYSYIQYEGASEAVSVWSRFLYLMVLLWWFFCVMWFYDTFFIRVPKDGMLHWQNMYCTLNWTAMNWDNSTVLWYTIEENDNHNHKAWVLKEYYSITMISKSTLSTDKQTSWSLTFMNMQKSAT